MVVAEKSIPDEFKRLLSSFNSDRAAALFFLALVIGAVLIFGGWGKPIVPALPVLAYGMVLIAAQGKYFVQLSSNLKDSPYFLGFILTLIEVLDIVWIGFPQQDAGPFLFREIGAAIVTTAVGLFMRQILVVKDPAEEAQDRIFRAIAEELRKDAVDFHDTQKLFVNLVKEFTQAREQMFADEERAFGDYMHAFQSAAQKLGALPGRVETTMSALETSGSRIAAAAAALEKQLVGTTQAFGRDVEALTFALSAQRTNLSSEISALNTALAELVKQTDDLGAATNRSLNEIGRANQGLGLAIGELSRKATGAGQEVDSLVKDLKRLTDDLLGIDQITDGLIRVLRERLAILDDAILHERSV